jgi:kynureninase
MTENGPDWARLRQAFELPDAHYFMGNSLGPLPHATRSAMRAVIEEQWSQGLIRSWNLHDWFHLPEHVGDRIAALAGAGPGEIVAGDSTSVCLFKLASAALRHSGRWEIITDRDNFPTDLYVLSGIRDLYPEQVEIRPLPVADIPDAVSERTALVLLSHVDFRSGRLYDMEMINRRAHDRGALVLWDLSHSIGALPVALNASGADLAVGCTYKYLNGGPGSPAFSYVSRELQASLQPILRGWMGHASPFEMRADFEAAAGIRGMVVGTPEVLALSAVKASLSLFEGLDLRHLRERSLHMSGALMATIDGIDGDHGLEIVTPREDSQRGSHVAIRHAQAYGIVQALIRRGVIGDFRAPDLMRFAITPLYQSEADIEALGTQLAEVLATREWADPAFSRRSTVT